MTYTDNLHLSLPEYADPMDVTPISANFAALDAALTAEGEARAAGDAALQEGLDAAYSPDNKPYVVGSYTGTNHLVAVTLGFRPSFVIISGNTSGSTEETCGSFTFLGDGEQSTNLVTFTDTGFVARYESWPKLSYTDRRYSYIAFR